jgi:hypothetical protein
MSREPKGIETAGAKEDRILDIFDFRPADSSNAFSAKSNDRDYVVDACRAKRGNLAFNQSKLAYPCKTLRVISSHASQP